MAREESIDIRRRELSLRSPALDRELSAASEVLRRRLTYDEHLTWERVVLDVAQGGFRGSEAAIACCKASVALSGRLRSFQLAQWWRLGLSLCELSPAVAAAYFRASPHVLGPLLADELDPWVAAGRRLFKDSWRLHELAAQFFDASPAMLGLLRLDEAVLLADLVAIISQQSIDGAATFLDAAVGLLGKIPAHDRLPVLKTGVILARHSAKAARAYLEAAPQALDGLAPRQRSLFVDLIAAAGIESADNALRLLREGSDTLARLDPAARTPLLSWGHEVATVSGAAAVELILASPLLLARLGLDQVERWLRQGISLLASSHNAGLAYFRIESQRAQQAMFALSHVCDLETVKPVLRLYCQALSGRDLPILATQELVARAVGWTSAEQATSDGASIYLPPHVEAYPAREDNFSYYKVLATHQAAHVEFGSYDHAALGKAGLVDKPPAIPTDGPGPIGDLEAFFDRFADRALAKHIFTILEDGRVDAAVHAEYRGIRRTYRRAQMLALRQRPKPFVLPLRQGCLEFLLQLSLDADDAAQAPPGLSALVASITQIALGLWQRRTSSLAETAQATIPIYDLLRSVPNVRIAVQLSGSGDGSEEVSSVLAELADSSARSPLVEEPFVGPDDVDYRGAMKPELVETLMRLRNEVDTEADGQTISPEALKRLLEKNLDFELSGLSEGEVDQHLGLFVSNLLGERGKAPRAKPRKRQRVRDQSAKDSYLPSLDAVELRSFYYDEWDFRARDYRPRWCRLSEQLVCEGSLDFYHRTILDNATLVRQLRQQFELLRPELSRRIKRLEDGEDFELDALVETIVERRAGHSPSEKVYWRRNKVQRDVAVAFLLDMSASTDEEIDEVKRNPWDDDAPRVRGKRIIDVEKESLVLLTQALEAIGDRYAVFGFSGYGRDSCEFYIVKDFAEDLGDRVKRRIDKIAPVRGTRMGVAIRHAAARLDAEGSKLRVLLLLSDGYPQDHDYYGTEQSERDYALHDTKTALSETKRKNIVPFCLTVDKSGHDYLRTMCADIGYEIVNDVKALPRRLPALYRTLTT